MSLLEHGIPTNKEKNSDSCAILKDKKFPQAHDKSI
jgi:hypothetical protein